MVQLLAGIISLRRALEANPGRSHGSADTLPLRHSSNLIPLQRLHVFAHSRGPHPAIKLWCQVPFTKSKTTFHIEIYCIQCFLKNKYIKSRNFNDKNRWVIKKVMVFKKVLQHLATRGTYSPGDWKCDEAWREQTLVYHPVMCQQRLIYCTWELNIMLNNVDKMTCMFHPGCIVISTYYCFVRNCLRVLMAMKYAVASAFAVNEYTNN